MRISHPSMQPVLGYFALAFGVSWVAGLIVAVVLQAVLPESMERATLLVAKFGPTIAGVVFAGVVAGRFGVLHLLRASLRVRAPLGWWVLALFGPAAFALAALALYHGTGGTVQWQALREITPAAAALALGTFVFFGGGFGEELGWRGFALPMLQRGMSAWRASLWIGAVWTAWHLPAYGLGGDDTMPIPLFTAFVFAASVLLTWMFNSTGGNVLLAVVFHGSVNATERLFAPVVAPEHEAAALAWQVGLYAAFALGLLLRYGGRTLSARERSVWPDSDGPPEAAGVQSAQS